MSKYPPAVQKALYARNCVAARSRCVLSNFARYEVEKLIWTSSHPASTPEQYETAMRAIAKACGV